MWLFICFTAFAYVCVLLLRTYTHFSYVCVWLLRTLYVFCVRIGHIFCASSAAFAYVYCFLCTLSGFTYVYSLYFEIFDVDRLEGSILAGSLICYFPCERSWLVESLKDLILRIPSSTISDQVVVYYCTVSCILSLGFCWVLFPRDLLIIIGPYRWSNI